MRIISDDRTTSFEINPNDPDDPYSDYMTRIDVKDVLNPFCGQNDSVLLLEPDSFLRQIAEFIQKREGVATLEMTEDCGIEFFRWDAIGNVGVKTRISKYHFNADGKRKNKSYIEVAFMIDGEFVNQMYKDFATLLR